MLPMRRQQGEVKTEGGEEGERVRKILDPRDFCAWFCEELRKEMCAVNSQNFQPYLAVYLSEN